MECETTVGRILEIEFLYNKEYLLIHLSIY